MLKLHTLCDCLLQAMMSDDPDSSQTSIMSTKHCQAEVHQACVRLSFSKGLLQAQHQADKPGLCSCNVALKVTSAEICQWSMR